MILTTHAIVGGALGSIPGVNIWTAFALGFASHFALDRIPHWDYHLVSGHEDPDGRYMNNDIIIGPSFFKDLMKIGFDAVMGIVLPLVFFSSIPGVNPLVVFAGALGGMCPDFLQFLYFKFRNSPLRWLQRFHIWAHTKIRLKDRPEIGVPLQIILVFLVVGVTIWGR